MEAPPLSSKPERASEADDVARFCEKHDLSEYLETAKRLARECLAAENMACEVMQDYETDDRWIVLRVDVHGSVESVLAAKKNYTAAWVDSVPWPQRFMIRLSFDIV